MANKRAIDLGVDTFMENVKQNRPNKADDKNKLLNEEVLIETEKENIPEEKNDDPVINTSSPREVNEQLLRNVVLTPETLFRLEAVQRMLNSNVGKGKRISLGALMGTIVEEYLDTKYPQTKELYKLMESMK